MISNSLGSLSSIAAKLQPHQVFLVLALIYGLSFLVVTPPFQIPDERNHFFKAYQVSTGQFKGLKEDNRVGGYIPKSLDTLTSRFSQLQGNLYIKTSKDKILQSSDLELNEEDLIFLDFPSTGKYSFVNYIPQALSIFVLKHIFSKVLWIYYGTKLLTFLFWLACITLAIYRMPFHKWLFTVLALLPMSLYINTSISGDIVTNAAAFLLIASLLKLAFSEATVQRKDLFSIALLMLVLASTKLVYTPLLLLFLLIPVDKFASRRAFIYSLGSLMLLTLGTVLFWYHAMGSIYTPYSEYNPVFREGLNIREGVHMAEQIAFLADHPLHIVKVMINAMGSTFDMVYEGYIGTFGWLETRLPLWQINGSYLIIVLLALLESSSAYIQLTWRKRGLMLISFFIIIGLIIVILFITWTLVGADYVHMQGRYLIPAAPLLFLMLYLPKFGIPRIVPILATVFCIVSLSLSYKLLNSRFYTVPEYTSIKINCSAEKIVGDLFLTSEPTVMLYNTNTRTKEMARTGTYGVMVNPKQQYSLTFRDRSFEYGDKLHAEIWRKGEDAGLVLQLEDGFYFVESNTDSTDTQGWSRIQIDHIFKERVEGSEIAVYVFNYGANTVYFDDLKINILKPNK